MRERVERCLRIKILFAKVGQRNLVEASLIENEHNIRYTYLFDKDLVNGAAKPR